MSNTLETLRYEIIHIRNPISSNSDEWQHTADQWLIKFTHEHGFFTMDFFTGSGHRKIKNKGSYGEHSIAVKPTIKDVVYSLYSDSQAANENFHDWCLNFGYSDDSIKAFNTYKECLEAALKLRKLGLSQSYLEKTYEGY